MNFIETFAGKLLTHGSQFTEGMGSGMMGWGHGFGWFMPIMFFAFWITIIVGVVYLIRWLSVSAKPKDVAVESAVEILKKRYAKGEIGKEEFQQMRKDLDSE